MTDRKTEDRKAALRDWAAEIDDPNIHDWSATHGVLHEQPLYGGAPVYSISLPHQCDGYKIAIAETPEQALSQLDAFIAYAQAFRAQIAARGFEESR